MPTQTPIATRGRPALEAMLASPPPDTGVRMVAALTATDAAAAAARSLVGAAGVLAREGEWLFVLRDAVSETEGWLWGERLCGVTGAGIGLSIPAGGDGTAVAGALAAAELAAERGASVCTSGMVELLAHARAAAMDRELDSAGRRMRLLRKLVFRLGPIQTEHVTGHCEQVGRTSARLAHLMGMDAGAVEMARVVGLLHDIGKAVFPEELLAKRQGLSPGERSMLARHASESAAVARALGESDAVCAAVAQHHDRFDSGASGRERLGGVVCVADALVTMTTERAYSPARSFTEALAELRRGRGTIFDPDAVVAAHLFGASAMSLAA